MENLKRILKDIIQKDLNDIAYYENELQDSSLGIFWVDHYDAIIDWKKQEIRKYQQVAKDYDIKL